MLPEAQRLRRSSVFARAYAARKAVSNQLLTLYVLERQPASSAKLPHVGFVVSKKVSGKAVVRNRLRRQTREAYRQLCLGAVSEVLPQASSNQDAEAASQWTSVFLQDLKRWYALVFVVQEGAIDADFRKIAQAVVDCLQKASRKYGQPAKRGNSNK